MDSYLYLFFHVLSHLLLGASIACVLLPKQTLKDRLASLFLGSLSGIVPDLFGARTINSWSHAIMISPFLVFVFAIAAQRIYKNVSLLRVWGVSTLTVWVGHLLLDYLGHEVALFYPISRTPVQLGVVTLGDPLIWIPLSVGVVLYLGLRKKPKLPAIAALAVVAIYLLLRVTAQETILYEVQARYPMSEKSYVSIEPNTSYEYKLFSDSWLEYRYEIDSSHHSQGGYAGMWGEKLGTVEWHYFYPEGRKFSLVNGQYVPQPADSKEWSLLVLEQWTENGIRYVRGLADQRIYTFKEVAEDKWVKESVT